MKKVLFFASLTAMIIASAGLVFANSSELNLLLLSTITVAVFMMTIDFFLYDTARDFAGVFVLVVCVHLFYLLSLSSYGYYAMLALCIGYAFCLGWLFYVFKKNTSPKILLGAALFAKVCLIPEEILNSLLSNASGQQNFYIFSILILAATSCYSIFGIYKMAREDMATKTACWVYGIMQICFAADVIACLIAFVTVILYKEPAAVEKTPLYKKASFSRTSARKKKH